MFETACGWMAITGTGDTVHHLRLGYSDADSLRTDLRTAFEPHGRIEEIDWHPALREQLAAYANGQPVPFTRVRYALPPLTEFQQAVIDCVRRIPYGQVRTYGEVAAAVGYPGAARAVGTVMSGNRLPIIIPCHRVVASGGKLGGYSAPRGIELKQWLLDLERDSLRQCPRQV